MPDRASAVTIILFTDLVGSTELLSRVGDEEAQRVFRAHHDLLTEAAAAHGGEEVKWLGDGLMVAFASAADAVRCAVAMQEGSRRVVQGERLAIRVGLNAGETLRDAADYFGTSVVVARRLCDRADAGQILCTELVAGLLSGRTGISFSALGRLELKGVPEPVAACEVRYEVATTGLPTRTEYVGREAEIRRLKACLGESAAGRGGLAVVVGDAGIGKTRMAEEIAEVARRDGGVVLSGRCLEGDWAPPYAPFVEALDALVGATEAELLRADLGAGAAALTQLVPRVRQVLPDIGDPPPVQPDEERFRLADAVAQFLIARSRRAPLLLCLDDLHWADKGTISMLRHVARLAPRHRLLVVGFYRGDEVGKEHPLTDALAALRREVEYERIELRGLDTQGVTALISALAEHELPEKVGAAWLAETGGNPFFLREFIRHLVEEGHLYRDLDGQWTMDRPVRELGVPEGVREVVARRLARLSETASKLLTVAAAFEGPFDLDVVAGVADLGEDVALEAVEEAVRAQVLEPVGAADDYMFTHALVRHTVYGDLIPSRRVRLHRRVAEALEKAYGERPTPARSAEIASQYHRSLGRPGAERGVDHALAAADDAERTGAHDEMARFLRVALDLLHADDGRRPLLLGRLGLSLIWALSFDDAVATALEAAGAVVEAEGEEAAAHYLAEATYAAGMAGSPPHAWALAREGLRLDISGAGVTWARLLLFDYQRQEAEDGTYPGIPIDSPERGVAARILQAAQLDPVAPAPMEAYFADREEASASRNLVIQTLWAGEYGRALPLLEAESAAAVTRGQFARASRCYSLMVECQAALGHIDDASRSLDEANNLASRVGVPVFLVLDASAHLALARNEGWDDLAPVFGSLSSSKNPSLAWALGYIYAHAARIAAARGEGNEAIGFLDRLVPWLERAPAWALGVPLMACHSAEVLWLLEAVKHASLIERTLREKVLRPDFRCSSVDGRLALARLLALQGRHDEAVSSFDDARRVLDEQGARPLRAICDFDEALMYLRRSDPGGAQRARPLLEDAALQFEAFGMTGWLRQAEALSP